MAFDESKFTNTTYAAREQDVSVPTLKDFFGSDEPPVFRVRGITGIELGRVHEAVRKHKNIEQLVEKILSTNNADKIEAIRQAMGITSDVPSEIVRRMEMLTIAAVSPKISQSLAATLCERFPIEFYEITDVILKLTGMGMDVGKSKPSGGTQQ